MNSISAQIRTMYAWTVRAASTLQSPFFCSSRPGLLGFPTGTNRLGQGSTTSPVWLDSSPASVSRVPATGRIQSAGCGLILETFDAPRSLTY
jgi:hypothetical protein